MRACDVVVEKKSPPIPRAWWKVIEDMKYGESVVVNSVTDVTAIRVGLIKKKSKARVSAEKTGEKYRVWRVR